MILSGPSLAGEPRSLTVDGQTREYIVHRPDGLSRGKPVPLVLMLHGALGSAEQAERAYGWDGAADRYGFVVAYPNGMHRTWNAGGPCCGRAARDGVNDVLFLDRLIETLVRDEGIDKRRVYIAGMSNGGAMTYRYACDGAFPVAAIGPVAASFTFACEHPRPVAVMAIHGLADKTVPYAGGAGRRGRDLIWQPVEGSLDVFRDADRCDAPAIDTKDVVATSAAHCGKGRDVVLITVADGGHQWPGSQPERGLGARLLHLDEPSHALDATTMLWNFFARHSAD